MSGLDDCRCVGQNLVAGNQPHTVLPPERESEAGTGGCESLEAEACQDSG